MCAKLGLKATVLHQFAETPSPDKVTEVISSASFAYVIGGNTPHLLKTLDSHGSDTLLRQAVSDGLWLTGTSAGALLPFKKAFSCPVPRPAEVEWEYDYLDGLDIVDAGITAHANQVDLHLTQTDRGDRFSYFAQTFRAQHILGFGVENNAGLIIDDTNLRVGRAITEAAVHVVTPDEIYTDVRDDEQLTELYFRHTS